MPGRNSFSLVLMEIDIGKSLKNIKFGWKQDFLEILKNRIRSKKSLRKFHHFKILDFASVFNLLTN